VALKPVANIRDHNRDILQNSGMNFSFIEKKYAIEKSYLLGFSHSISFPLGCPTTGQKRQYSQINKA
jgi:hypothetical protein